MMIGLLEVIVFMVVILNAVILYIASPSFNTVLQDIVDQTNL